MSNQSAANGSSAPEQAQVPEIRSFEFDKKAIGKIKNSVNLFRGTVSLPIEFLTLPGRQGLDVKVSALYQGNVDLNVAGWNVDQPTGILGLGWEMPLEQIKVDKGDSGSAVGDRWFFFNNGASNPLYKIAEQGKWWLFEARNFSFWDIRYNPTEELWVITKENGFVYEYGGKDSDAIEWGVKWGNFIGSSSERAGQERYARAWNLASAANAWGNKVTYRYLEDLQKVGSNSGLSYTRASYLLRIEDSFGRSLDFIYGDKFGAENPSPDGIIEYQARNAGRPAPNGYQNTYQTRFLSRVNLNGNHGDYLYSICFGYKFSNYANTSADNRALFWKRQLASVWEQDNTGKSLPPMTFDYNEKGDINPGALKKINYPEGGTASYTYKNVFFSSPRDLTITNPMAGSTPRVWHGPNYVVNTFYKAGSGIIVKVATWNGGWVEKDITPSGMAGVTIDLDSLLVVPEDETLVISFRNTTSNRDEIYLYNLDPTEFGNWKLYLNQPKLLSLKSTDAPITQIATGNRFILAFNKAYSAAAFQGFEYKPTFRQWDNLTLLPSSSDGINADGTALTGFGEYFLSGFYFSAQRTMKYELIFRDTNGIWQKQTWNTGNLEVLVEDGRLLWVWNPRGAYAGATFISKSTSTDVEYSIIVYQWDERFFVTNASTPLIKTLTTPVQGNETLYQIFKTNIVNGYLNNNPLNLRDVGGAPGSGNSNWLERMLTIQGSATKLQTASGSDVTLLSETVGAIQNQLLTFDPNFNTYQSQSIANGVGNPTISGDYMTLGDALYIRNLEGNWVRSRVSLQGFGFQESMQNRGNNYLAYQSSDDNSARSWVVQLVNGTALNPTELQGNRKIYVPGGAGLGTLLAGPRFLVSYPASDDFNSAGSLTLTNIDKMNLDQPTIDTPVAVVEIETKNGGAPNFVQSYFYGNDNQSLIAFDPLLSVAQYPFVIVVPGVRSSNTRAPSEQPFGRQEVFFSNSLSPQNRLNYPQGWIYNYLHLTEGLQLASKSYDDANTLVEQKLNYWEVVDTNPNGRGPFYYGGYINLVRNNGVRDGVTTDVLAIYEPTHGSLLFQKETYYDADGAAKTAVKELTYAWQVPAFQQAFEERHIFTEIAQETTSVVDVKSGDVNYTSSKAYTFKNWNAVSSKLFIIEDINETRIGKLGVYQWTAPGPNKPVFDFSDPGPEKDWLETSLVLKRGPISGVIIEQKNQLNLSNSFCYDKAEGSLVAGFQGASLAGQETGYSGFESYESDSPFQIGSRAEVVPSDTNPMVDANSGSHSLLVQAGANGDQAVHASWFPAKKQDYIFSSWVKKPAGFDGNKGDASWSATLLVSGSPIQTITEPFPASVGEWAYLSMQIPWPENVDEGALEIEVQLNNHNTDSFILVDDLRFSPFACLFLGNVYTPDSMLIQTQLGANGECTRNDYDTFGQSVLVTSPDQNVSMIKGQYFSRQGNLGFYNPDDPNAELVRRSRLGGRYDNFLQGDEWQETWQPGSGDQWEAGTDGLVLAPGQNEGTLTGMTQDNYGLIVEPYYPEGLVNQAGVNIGSAFTVQWNPQNLSWELLKGTTLVESVQDIQLTISDSFAANLDDETVTPKMVETFLLHGFSLEESDSVTVVTLGESWRIKDDISGSFYSILKQGGQLLVTRPNLRWDLQLADRLLLFYADNRLIFSYLNGASIQGEPTLFFNNSVGLRFTALYSEPQLSVSFLDSNGNGLQGQLLEDERAVVSQYFFDELGRRAVQTKSAYVSPEADRPLMRFLADFAVLNWDDFLMSGLVADAYPGDEGYPYYRNAFETSPLSRVVAQGEPGKDFRIGARSTSLAYGPNDSTLGLRANSFYQVTVTDPDGNVSFEIFDILERTLFKVAVDPANDALNRNQIVFDDAGFEVERRSPNYFDPPADSQADNWRIVSTFDYAGRVLTKKAQDGGVTRYIYNTAGNLRFQQSPSGAVNGNYNYIRYDDYGRPIENGYLAGDWNEAELLQQAEDPSFPATPPTWRRQIHYDGDQSIPCSIGRVDAFAINNANHGEADVHESFRYDLNGNTVRQTLLVPSFDVSENQTDLRYDNLGNNTQVIYPDGFRLNYRYNRLNQVSQLIQDDNSAVLATLEWRADGQPVKQILDPDGQLPVVSEYGFNSPQWLTDIHTKENAEVFSQGMTYTSGGFQDKGFYNGNVASSHYGFGGKGGDYGFQFDYNHLNWMTRAVSDQKPAWSLGKSTPVSFDANGNTQSAELDDTLYHFNYQPGTQRLLNIADQSTHEEVLAYSYNDDGNILTQAENGHVQAFTYDPMLQLTRTVEINQGELVSGFFYGGDAQRVLKTTSGSQSMRKLYIRGTFSYPILERVLDGENNETQTRYIYSPAGLIQMHRGNESYNLVKDHLGSIRLILNQAGDVVAHYNYDIYGETHAVIEPEPGFMTYLYTGQEMDLELQLYNYRARFYQPRIGRFVAVDPQRQFFSPYLYGSNNPILFVDPDGRFSFKKFFSAVAGVLIGAVEILIGVAIDVVAGVLEVVTGGLGTPAAIALAAASGVFYGAGSSAILYSVFHTQDFSWRDYGINMGIGALAGGITAGFSAAGSIAAEAATGVKAAAEAGQAVSTSAKVADFAIDTGVTTLGGVVASGVSTSLNDVANNTVPGADVGEAMLFAALSGVGSSVLSAGAKKIIPSLDKPGTKDAFVEAADLSDKAIKNYAVNLIKDQGKGIAFSIGKTAAQKFGPAALNAVKQQMANDQIFSYSNQEQVQS